jgi:hypothetical protein
MGRVGGNQMNAAANAIVSSSGVRLHQVLTEGMADRYGLLALIRLPQEEDILLDFIEQMGAILSDKGIFRRDSIAVLADCNKARLNELEPEVFCSWAQSFVINFKITYDNNNIPQTSYKDMPTEVAKKTLMSPSFLKHIPEITDLFPIPLPIKINGTCQLISPGFNDGSYTFEFK